MTAKPVAVEFSSRDIPPELIALPRWLLWSYTLVGDKWTKVPFQSNGRKASTTNAGTWGSFTDVMAASRSYDGLGFVFNGDGLVGIDLDHVIDDSGMWSDTAQDILDMVPGYAEVSPSGTGLHIITRADNTGTGKAKNGIEVYSTGRYFTFTGSVISSHKNLLKNPQDLSEFVSKYFAVEITPRAFVEIDPFGNQPLGKASGEVRELLLAHSNADVDYEDWFRIIASVHHELGEDGREIAHEWSSSSVKHTDERFDISWNSLGRYTGRSVTLRSLLKGKSQKSIPEDVPTESDLQFKFYPGAEYAADFEALPEVVEDIFPAKGLAMVYGPSGRGKTFWVLDLAFHIHNGVKWRDKDVIKGDVMYIAAEAGRGIKKRIRAVTNIRPDWVPPFIADIAPDLSSLVSLEAVRDAAKAVAKPSVIIVDTMSASFEGDDSSQKDVSKMLRNMSALSDDLNCLIIFVHHTTKDGGSYRGSGALYGNVDAVLELVSEKETEKGERNQWFHQWKNKDGESGRDFPFKLLVSEPLAFKPNGKPITSCTIEHLDELQMKAVNERKKKALTSGPEIFIWETFEDCLGMADSLSEEELIEAVREKQKLSGKDVGGKAEIKALIGKLENKSDRITREGNTLRRAP